MSGSGAGGGGGDFVGRSTRACPIVAGCTVAGSTSAEVSVSGTYIFSCILP